MKLTNEELYRILNAHSSSVSHIQRDIDVLKTSVRRLHEKDQLQDAAILSLHPPKPEPKYPCLTCKHGHRFIGSPCSFIRCSLNSSKLTQDATHCCDYAEKQ
jgi:hypothetical protein